MKLTALLCLLALAAGCSRCWPCKVNEQKAPGFRHVYSAGDAQTHCIPCFKAVTPEALFVCTGLTYTAEAK